jgi:FkbM family methyltransferase
VTPLGPPRIAYGVAVSLRPSSREVAVRVRRTLRARGLDVVRYPVEGSLWALIDRVFRMGSVASVLDVGAHVGEFGSFLRDHGYRGDIFSFEPVPDAYEALARRADGDPRWHVHRYALGAVDGTRTFRVAKADNLSSFLEPSVAGRTRFDEGIAARDRIEVDIRRLDSVFAEVTAAARPGGFYLKCDTQGVDLDVVEGTGDVLSTFAGVQLELDLEPLYEGSGTFVDGLSRLGSRGFRLAGVFPVARDGRARLLQVEAVFVPAA